MERMRVDSNNIASIGYCSNRGTLEVEFIKGGVYHYLNVPERVYDELMTSSSHGLYLTENIKGSYNYRRL